MDQLVHNCLLYNPAGSFVRELGQRLEQRWLDNWRRNPVLAPYAAPVRRWQAKGLRGWAFRCRLLPGGSTRARASSLH